mmetsp:Transcript_43308/g.52518  ORF Transcript_43308/g.52518 Transcript_43308/m.52518 type:complete len:81 (+) Transcript_43308:59-301(+)
MRNCSVLWQNLSEKVFSRRTQGRLLHTRRALQFSPDQADPSVGQDAGMGRQHGRGFQTTLVDGYASGWTAKLDRHGGRRY